MISLKDKTDLVLRLKNDHNINVKLFRGINGRECRNDIIERNFTLFYRYFGPKSAIGCALSHISIWKTFLRSNKKYAIIFEDDIILDNVKGDLLKKIIFFVKKTPDDFDILYLGALGSSDVTNFFSVIMSLLNINSKIQHVNNYIKKPQVALATHSYVLSRSGAKKLLDNLSGKINNHIDYCIQNLYSKGVLNNYITKPRLLYQSSTNSGISTNVSNTYPIIINKLLSHFYLDKFVKANYISTLSILRLGNFNFTISSIMICILTLIYSFSNKHIFLFILLISLSDIQTAINI